MLRRASDSLRRKSSLPRVETSPDFLKNIFMAQHTLRILLVEDHPDTAVALRDYLESLGHHVVAAKTMATGLQALAAEGFDFLLCDVGLPDGTGWDLLKQAPHAPHFCVAMSGMGKNADSARSHAAGFDHHLTKPFKPEELEHLLEKAESAS
jgi:CheY-like chemotaxis protein